MSFILRRTCNNSTFFTEKLKNANYSFLRVSKLPIIVDGVFVKSFRKFASSSLVPRLPYHDLVRHPRRFRKLSTLPSTTASSSSSTDAAPGSASSSTSSSSSCSEAPSSNILAIADDHVKVELVVDDGGSSPYHLHYIWLRDHCRCATCFNAATNQRSLEIDEVDLDVKPKTLRFTNSSATAAATATAAAAAVAGSGADETLEIVWEDGHATSFSVDFLSKFGRGSERATTTTTAATTTTTWDNGLWQARALPIVPYHDFMNTDDGLRDFLEQFVRFGFAIVEGASATISGTREVSERVAFVQPTTFGDIWTFTADMKRGDTAYTNLALGSHNDSTYLRYGTGIQVFHVMYHDGAGGQTTLVDGFRAAETLKEEVPQCFDALKRLSIGAEYIDADANLQYVDNIIKENPVDGTLEQIRFNIYDRSPLSTVPTAEIPLFYRSLKTFAGIVKRPSMVQEVALRPGMVLFVDNWRVMHGRRSFDGKRVVSGCYLPRDDWRSKARLLGCRLN